MAARLLKVPFALVSLVDKDRQWFKSCVGISAPETPRDSAFCAHAIYRRETLVVQDTLNDIRFAENPLVLGAPFLRFYVGVPLFLKSGACVGTLCALSDQPRSVSNRELRALEALALAVSEELESATPSS